MVDKNIRREIICTKNFNIFMLTLTLTLTLTPGVSLELSDLRTGELKMILLDAERITRNDRYLEI